MPCPPEFKPNACVQRKGKCNAYCERSIFCRGFGQAGIRSLDESRKYPLGAAIVFGIFSICLRIPPIFALSTHEGILKALPWGVGDVRCTNPAVCGEMKTHVYIGLNAYYNAPSVPSVNVTEQLVHWSDANCDVAVGAVGDFCNACKEAATGAVMTVITSVIQSLVGLKSDIQRFHRKNDHNCAKVMSIVTGILSTSMQLSALAAFQAGCTETFPVDQPHIESEWSVGAGWIMLLVACILKLIMVVIHILVPTPNARWKRTYDSAEDPAAGEWPVDDN